MDCREGCALRLEVVEVPLCSLLRAKVHVAHRIAESNSPIVLSVPLCDMLPCS